jgi:hypothetical protein
LPLFTVNSMQKKFKPIYRGGSSLRAQQYTKIREKHCAAQKTLNGLKINPHLPTAKRAQLHIKS